MKKIFLLIIIIFLTMLGIKKVNAQGGSYCVMDTNNLKVIEGRNVHDPLLIASTVKIMTAILCIENCDIEEEVEVTREDTLMEGSKVYLVEGDTFKIKDILYGLLLRSGNDCANLISRVTFGNQDYFVERMNELGYEIGLKESVFENPSGLDSNSENLVSAYDLALLMNYCMKNETFYQIASTIKYRVISKENNAYYWVNKDKLVASKDYFIAGKTGFTKRSGRILVNYIKEESSSAIIVTINQPNDWAFHEACYQRFIKEKKSSFLERIINKGIFF